MKVECIDSTTLSNVVLAARTCYNSFKGQHGDYLAYPTHDLYDDDKELLKKLMHTYKHESVFEHCYFVFKIESMPRFVLQELARHRMASYSVKSTRHTLKELRNEEPFVIQDISRVKKSIWGFNDVIKRAGKYIDIHTKSIKNQDWLDFDYINMQLQQLEILRKVIASQDLTLDECKYFVPENYLTDAIWTINIRSLRNFLNLRLSPKAHFKIQELARLVYNALPDETKFLFDDIDNYNDGEEDDKEN